MCWPALSMMHSACIRQGSQSRDLPCTIQQHKCFANAETLTGEEQEALDGRQGSNPAVSNLYCVFLGLYLPVL